MNPNIDAAVCGSDDYINYYKITYATNIAHQTKLLFGTNYDNNWKTNIIIPGAYTYISSIETASEVKATIAAKPNKEALKIIFRDNNLDHEDPSIKSKILMIGDSLRTDIKFAQNCGIDSCLVLTGMIKYEELNDKLITCTPTYIVEDLKI
jgi:4-nitrophenyl phosphatase